MKRRIVQVALMLTVLAVAWILNGCSAAHQAAPKQNWEDVLGGDGSKSASPPRSSDVYEFGNHDAAPQHRPYAGGGG